MFFELPSQINNTNIYINVISNAYLSVVREKKSVSVGVSFDEDLLEKIDRDRGDVPRSKFIKRLVDEAYTMREKR